MIIYFDNSATTKILPSALEEMNNIYENVFGNPSSLHKKGLEAENALDSARKTLAETVNAAPEEIIFTSGGTESNNFAIRGYLKRNPHSGKRIITSSVEHPSVANVFKSLESEGFEVLRVPVGTDGVPDLDFLANAVDENTALVSFMAVNNETGVIFDIPGIKKIISAKNKNTVLHSDCVQAYMKLPINVKSFGADMISVSAHKINGPRGIGFLYKKKDIKLSPLVYGGGQEGNLRSGTENLPAICAFAKAAEFHRAEFEENIRKMREVKNYLSEKLKEINGALINSPENGACHILNVSFPGRRSEVTLHMLESKGIYVSSGSACSSNFKEKHSVLAAMGFEKERYDSAIRFSFSFENSEEEAEFVSEAIKEIISN